MKKIGTILLMVLVVLQLSAHGQVTGKANEHQTTVNSDTTDHAQVIIGNDVIKIDNSKEALKVRAGDRGISLLESLEGGYPKVTFDNYSRKRDNGDQEDKDEERANRRQRFTGHWAGLEVGFNNIVTAENSMTMPNDINYMNMHSGKSVNFNLNFAQLSMGVARHAGFVTGLGINWNNYRFDGNYNIQKLSDGTIDSVSPLGTLKKSKLATIYLTMPLLFEVQIPANHNRLHIAAGAIGAIKLDSHSRMVFENGPDVKNFSDFSLNMLRYGVTARIGYQNLHFYGTYYLTPMFKSKLGPGGYDLHPFEIGLAFTFPD
jgi:hypothetical protein